jgi:hypothetical protein
MSRSKHDSASDAGIGRTQTAPDFRVAIDFGTTFTAIAFTHSKQTKPRTYTMEEFPGDRLAGRNGTQVPTEIWYSAGNSTRKKGPRSRADMTVLYGYEVVRQLEFPPTENSFPSYTKSGLISKPKLLLDDNAHFHDLRKPLVDVLNQLKKSKAIFKDEDVITDLLTCFLDHTKYVLSRDWNYDSKSTGITRSNTRR